MRMNDFRSKSEIFKNSLKFCLLILLLYVEEKAILYWDILQVNFFFFFNLSRQLNFVSNLNNYFYHASVFTIFMISENECTYK